MAQTEASNYGFRLDTAQAGQKAGLDFDHVESYAAEGAVPFGHGVVLGTDPAKQVAVAAADTDTFAGISVFTHRQEQGIDQGASMGAQYSTGAEYRDKDTVNVLRRGRVWVENSENGFEAHSGDTAYVDTENGNMTVSPNRAIIEFDADFVANNEIDMDINGESITTVTFDDDHETTFAALVAEIESTLENDVGLDTSNFNVESDAEERKIVISASVKIEVTNADVTEGASQPDITVTEPGNLSTDGVFRTGADVGELAIVEINLP